MKLTKRQVDSAKCETNKPIYMWDGSIKGFGVKILPSGIKRYVFKYRSYGGGRRAVQRWMQLGTHGEMPFEKVREHARQVSAAVGRGEDPQGEKLAIRAAPTLRDAWERLEVELLPKRKDITVRDYRAAWVNNIEPKLGKVKVRDVSRTDIDRLHKSISKTAPFLANRVLALLSKMMNMAEAWEWRDQGTNPCRFVEKNEENKRERYLSGGELKRLGEALNSLVDLGLIWPDMANVFRLLLLTGARKNEIAACEWAWIDWENSIIRLPDSKTGAKPLYLSGSAVQVLKSQKITTRRPDSEFVFPGVKRDGHIINLAKPWRLICQEADLPDVRIHDLRHTAASIAVGQGVALPIIGRLLGHSQAQTTARYAHVDSDPALAAANVVGTALEDKL
jgi:integrase